MEIERGMLVAIISGPWAKDYCVALVTDVETKKFELRLNLNDAASSRVYSHKRELFPIAENCMLKDLQKILAMPKFPEIIQSLAIKCAKVDKFEQQVESLQKKLRALESNLGSISMGLGETQKELRSHILGPH